MSSVVRSVLVRLGLIDREPSITLHPPLILFSPDAARSPGAMSRALNLKGNAMPKESPVYVVTVESPKGEKSSRLVRAANGPQAFNHVSRQVVSVSRATTDEIVALTKAGVEVESVPAAD
jgi:hypothetical protein